MSEIKKNKNLLEFWIDGKAKPYVFDINTATMYGLRGGAITSMPHDVMKLVRANRNSFVMQAMKDAFTYNRAEYLKMLSLCDRIDALNIDYSNVYCSIGQLYKYLDVLTEQFKTFAKALQENGTEYRFLNNFAETLSKVAFSKKHHLVANEHLTEEMISFLYHYTIEYHHLNEQYMGQYAYFLPRGLWDFFGGDYHRTDEFLRQLTEYCQSLGVDMEKSDFFRQYINRKREYERKKEEIDRAEFSAAQNKHLAALTYENNDFVVIIPQTTAELETEGNRQRNCVGSYGKRVKQGHCNIVFVRKKTNVDAPYITCEVYNNGRIGQYLTRYNEYPTEQIALDFKVEYENHILANW